MSNPTNHVQPNNLSLPKHNHLDHINQPNNNIPNPAIQNIATLHVQNSHNHTIHPNQAIAPLINDPLLTYRALLCRI